MKVHGEDALLAAEDKRFQEIPRDSTNKRPGPHSCSSSPPSTPSRSHAPDGRTDGINSRMRHAGSGPTQLSCRRRRCRVSRACATHGQTTSVPLPPSLLLVTPSTHLHLQSVSDYRRNKLPNKVDPAPISYSDNLTPDSDLVSENLLRRHYHSLYLPPICLIPSSHLEDTLTRIATTQMNGRPEGRQPLGFLILSTGTVYDDNTTYRL